jgi:hypothetical protein
MRRKTVKRFLKKRKRVKKDGKTRKLRGQLKFNTMGAGISHNKQQSPSQVPKYVPRSPDEPPPPWMLSGTDTNGVPKYVPRSPDEPPPPWMLSGTDTNGVPKYVPRSPDEPPPPWMLSGTDTNGVPTKSVNVGAVSKKRKTQTTSKKRAKQKSLVHYIPRYHMYLFESNTDLWDAWIQDGGKIIIENSPMGCGYNVLAMLQIITREQALNEIQNMISNVYTKESGLSLYSFSKILINYMGNFSFFQKLANYRIETRYYNFKHYDIPSVVNNIITEFKPEGQGLYYYAIIKLLINLNTNLGHTILMSLDTTTTPYTFEVLDPQKNRKFFIDNDITNNDNKLNFIPYLIRNGINGNGYYKGISCMYAKYNEKLIIGGGESENNLIHNIEEISDILDLNVPESQIPDKDLEILNAILNNEDL